MTAYLRPDEKLNIHEKERAASAGSNLAKGAMALGSVALGAGSGAIASRLAPFFSEYIPPDLAIKGISKIAPSLGKILQSGQKMGLDVQEGIATIADNFSPARQDASIIKQHSPELHSFIEEEVKKGAKPIEAASKASRSKKFDSVIKKLVKEHSLDWSSIVETVFGKADMAPVQPGQGQQMPQAQGAEGVDPALAQVLQQGQMLMQKFRGQM